MRLSLIHNKRNPRTMKHAVPFLLLSLTPALAAQETPSNQELSRRIDLLASQFEQEQIQEATGVLTSQFGMGPAASKIYSRAQGISVGGYSEMLYTSPTDGGDGATWDIYRVVTYLGYRFDEQWLFNSEIELEHMNEAAVEFAYLDYEATDNLSLRFGHLLTPMGWVNEMHEPTTFWSANRPQLEKEILPSTWHENGMGAVGSFGDFSYRAYLMNGFSADGFNLEKDGVRGGRQKGSKAKADHLATIVRIDWTGYQGLTIGGSYYSGQSGQIEADAEFQTTIWDIHAEYKNGPLRLRGLKASATVDDFELLSQEDANLTPINQIGTVSGYYVEAGWDVFAGKTSSLTPFFRYEVLEKDARSGHNVYGVAYQPTSGTIFKLDYLPGVEKIEFAVGWTF